MGNLLILNGSPRAPRSNSRRYAQIFSSCYGENTEYFDITKRNHRSCVPSSPCPYSSTAAFWSRSKTKWRGDDAPVLQTKSLSLWLRFKDWQRRGDPGLSFSVSYRPKDPAVCRLHRQGLLWNVPDYHAAAERSFCEGGRVLLEQLRKKIRRYQRGDADHANRIVTPDLTEC